MIALFLSEGGMSTWVDSFSITRPYYCLELIAISTNSKIFTSCRNQDKSHQ